MAHKYKVQLSIIYTLIGIVAFIFGSLAAALLRDTRPPIEAFISAETMNSPVMQGDALEVKVRRVKVRDDCRVTALRTAQDVNGRPWDVPDAVNIPGGPADSEVHFVRYPIPDYLPVGEYEMRVHLIYDCRGLVFHYDQPPARFHIIAKG